MSKKSKTAAREKRLQKKRAIKAGNKAKYASWAKAGENTKSFRFKKKKTSKSFKGLHIVFTNCGNPACKKCFNHTVEGAYLKYKLKTAS